MPASPTPTSLIKTVRSMKSEPRVRLFGRLLGAYSDDESLPSFPPRWGSPARARTATHGAHAALTGSVMHAVIALIACLRTHRVLKDSGTDTSGEVLMHRKVGGLAGGARMHAAVDKWEGVRSKR